MVHIDQIIEAAGGYLSRNSEDGASTTEILLPQSSSRGALWMWYKDRLK
ncbi:hypothetical protein [Bifidobacterium bifidum]|nr:hypothetical protein [Bifidobacterium bifidum]